MSTDLATSRGPAVIAPINAAEVARAINNIYLVLEPWQDAEWANAEVALCNVSSFANIVQSFQFQGRKFATAVDLSVKTSRDGIILAVDSLTFLSAIEQNRNEGDVLLYFRGLLEIARDSFDKAKKCEQDFHEIYTGIIGISNAVPKAIQAVKERRVRVGGDARRRASAAEHCRVGKEAIKDVRMAEGFFSWASPVGQGLHIALPILQVMVHYAENANRKKFEERHKRLKALFDAIERLQTVDGDLFNVGCCLRTLVMWWSNTKAQLEQITNNLELYGVSFYRNDNVRNSVRNSWNRIKKEYSGYRDEVSIVQDRYIDDMEPLGEVDVGRKGVLLAFQGDIQVFYERLTTLKDIAGTKPDDHKQLQHALSSIEAGFISRLKIIDCSIEDLLRCIKAVDPIQRYTEYGHVISRFFQLLLAQGDDYALSCARELENMRHLITADYSGAKAILNSMKMRLKNPTLKARTFEVIGEMEEKNEKISKSCVDLFANGLWHIDENFEECLIETRRRYTWLIAKLEHAAVGEVSRVETERRPTLYN